jgi:hypothetical protein
MRLYRTSAARRSTSPRFRGGRTEGAARAFQTTGPAKRWLFGIRASQGAEKRRSGRPASAARSQARNIIIFNILKVWRV